MELTQIEKFLIEKCREYEVFSYDPPDRIVEHWYGYDGPRENLHWDNLLKFIAKYQSIYD